jgi:hypothetical protein
MGTASRISLFLAALTMAGALTVASAGAAIVTVGSPISLPLSGGACFLSGGCTVANTVLTSPAAHLVSPVDGLVVRWRVEGGSAIDGYALRTMKTGSAGLIPTGTSSSALLSSSGLETFPTHLPIKAGEYVGLDIPEGGAIGYAPSGDYAFGAPKVAEGGTLSTEPHSGEIAFNADVQPVPTVTSVAPAAGPFRGGSKVVITGTDFEGASAVMFGSTSAAFTLVSETQITATAPGSKSLGKVTVTVTTDAGTATSPTKFEYQGCKVPNLGGKKLKAAKKSLRKANCKLGKVKKLGDATTKTGKVVKQNPKSGKVLAPKAKVSVTLG